MIEIDSLNVRFGAFHAVRDTSFRVAEGEAVGLVGESRFIHCALIVDMICVNTP